MTKKIIRKKSYSSDEDKAWSQLRSLYQKTPIPNEEMLHHLSVYMNRQTITRLLLMDYLYNKILDVHGAIMEFGTRWGRDLLVFQSLMGIYEPYNINRRIIGFDTFEGFLSIKKEDGKHPIAKKGSYNVTEGYERHLNKIMKTNAMFNPVSHIDRFEIIKGDASKTLDKYLAENPQTIIAFAYFDMDLYEPTKKCLELIKNHLTKGSVIGFDELNKDCWPGETIAFNEVMGSINYSIKRTPFSGDESYIVIE